MNSSLLKSQIILNEKNMSDVANELGVCKSSLYRKLKGETQFTRQEISRLIKYLNLDTDTAMNIFFNEKCPGRHIN